MTQDTAPVRRGPALIRVADLPRIDVASTDTKPPMDPGNAPNTGFARIITNEEFGAQMLLGIFTIPPGDVCGWVGNGVPGMTGYGPADYAYLVLSGTLRVEWGSPAGDGALGAFDAGPEEAIYMPPGFKYCASNVGNHTARVAYFMTPPQLGVTTQD
jgi:hypothetical protein